MVVGTRHVQPSSQNGFGVHCFLASNTQPIRRVARPKCAYIKYASPLLWGQPNPLQLVNLVIDQVVDLRVGGSGNAFLSCEAINDFGHTY
jgi:hypothetical protein